jgi:hypothetical protein
MPGQVPPPGLCPDAKQEQKNPEKKPKKERTHTFFFLRNLQNLKVTTLLTKKVSQLS